MWGTEWPHCFVGVSDPLFVTAVQTWRKCLKEKFSSCGLWLKQGMSKSE